MDIAKRVKELKELQSLIEEAQLEAEYIKCAIKAFMGDSEELRAGEYKIIYKPVTTARIDAKALKQALPDIAAAFTKKNTVRRFVVV
ncbi:hypothetical protein LJC01_03040 [Clostridiaceae bacterium OttesenSCG-928-D20]|nr:hypothetical protein [Clostridiaceae bacterium OttesenSCG-928-D20]